MPCAKVVLLVIDEAHRATGNYAYCKIIDLLETSAKTGFRIVALSATPVSKIENLQAIVTSLRCCKFEVRDECDAEVKKYTHDKNIVEVLVDKEDTISAMEKHIGALQEICLKFLRTCRLVGPDVQAKYINKMTILNLQEDVQRRQQYGSDMIGAIFQRTATLMSLCHAKKLLATHGYESFAEYITGFFDLTKKDKKNAKFIKQMKEQPEYDTFITFLVESRKTKNHPKLRKLAEILIDYFKSPENATSKVIVFSQFRDSAKEIKNYLDLKTEGLVKADIFVG